MKLDLTGVYICNGFDIHDGPFSGNRLEMIANEQCQNIAPGYAAYDCKAFTADGVETYVGSIIANGNQFAMSFRNILAGQDSDYGVLIGAVTHDRDETGAHRTVLHNTYYQPQYNGGGHGTATCIKKPA